MGGATSKVKTAINNKRSRFKSANMESEPITKWKCGLTVVGKNYPVPLKSIDVNVTIRGFIANVSSTLKYKNVESNPIEAVFEFPLDDQSAVYQFEAQIEDRIIVAECQEKEQAKQTYDDAMEYGQTAMLLEEDATASDIFRCLVGNLPPDTEATIKFSYVLELALTPEGTVQFTLPTQLNPRYNPRNPEPGTKRSPDFVYTAKDCDQPYTFNFNASVFNNGKIVSIKSLSEKDDLVVTVDSDGTHADVKLVKDFLADHDLTLVLTYDQQFTPHVIIEKGDSSKTGILNQDVLMLNFFPQLSESAFSSKHEFIFVIDRSGSMDGPRIVSARQALLVFLKSLPTGCYFNIVSFGSNFEFLFSEGSREYSEQSLKEACQLQETMEADMGGTEILEPLKAIYDKAPMKTHSRQVMLLTDGEVSNTAAVIDIVRKNANNTRLFSFGIGEGASTSLIKGIARAGRGKAEFVKTDDQTTALVMKTLKAAMQAAVTDVELDWQLGGSPKLIQVPRTMPPLFAGDRLIVYAINSGSQSVLDGRVELKGKLVDQAVHFSLDIDAAKDVSPPDATLAIHRLAAKAEINHLQDNEKEDSDKVKAEIIVLSLAANIVSHHTSMVGVDKGRTEKVTGEVTKRSVPLIMSAQSAYAGMLGGGFGGCYGGGGGGSLRSTGMACYGMAQPMMMACRSAPMKKYCARSKMAPQAAMCYDAAPPAAMLCDSFLGSSLSGAAYDPVQSFDAAPPPPPPAAPAPVTYLSVVALQQFNGSWKLDDKLAHAAGVDLQKLQDSNPIKSVEVWATAVALSVLAAKFSDKKDEWEMIEMKAKQWLAGQDLGGQTIDNLLQRAAGIL